MDKALAIDIGGTKIAYAMVDKKGEFLSEIKKINTPKSASLIEEKLKEIIKENENRVDIIAIATAGAVNNENTKILGSTANLAKGYKDIDFQKLSQKKVFIENDANCAAWAEYKMGASKGTNNSIMLTLGTGVGGGIIINNKLLKGKSGKAGEMHFKMSRKKERPCTCGEYDCFEAYASGNGLIKTAVEIFKDDNITTYDIIDLAKKGNEDAKRALEIWQNDIIEGIIGLQNIFDTECFVLSGSMEKFIDVKFVEDSVNKRILTSKTKVCHGKSGNYSGMIGAALLALNRQLN